jgi:hypothetical protein
MKIIDLIKSEIDAAIGKPFEVVKVHVEKCLEMAIGEVLVKNYYDQVLLKNTFYQLERITDEAIALMLEKSLVWVKANADRFFHRPSSMEVYMNIKIGEPENKKANRMIENAVVMLADQPLLEEPVMKIVDGLGRDDRRLLATYCHHVIRSNGATTTWTKGMFAVAICLLRIEYAVCKKDGVWDLFVNSMMSCINRLNTSDYKQQAKDLTCSALKIGYREHIEEHAYVIGSANYTDSGNYVMALFYMQIAMAYLDKKGGMVPHRLAIDIIWDLLKIIRETRSYKQESLDMLLETFDNLKATDFETISVHLTALDAKLFVEDKTVVNDTLRFINTYDRQLKAYEENVALPLYSFFMTMHEVFADEDLKEQKPYEEYWASKVKRDGNELYLDFYDDRKSVFDHLKVVMAKMEDIRNTEDYAHDCKTAQILATKVLDEAANENRTDKFLLAMTLKSDYTFIKGDRYAVGMAPVVIRDVKAENVKTDYGDTEHLREWIHLDCNDIVIWIGKGKKNFYKMTLYQNMYNIETIERWNSVNFGELRRDIISNLKYQESYKNRSGETCYKTEEELKQEDVELKEKLMDCRFNMPEHPQRLLFVKEIEVGAYPHQLLIDEGKEQFVGTMKPSANVLSTEFLMERCEKNIMPHDFSRTYWSPDSECELTFGWIIDRIEETLKTNGFDISMGKEPNAPLAGDLNIVCAHGGKNISETEWLYAGSEPILDTGKIIGKGEILILFVCHSGSISHKEYENVMHTMIKRYIRMGYKTVIAPMWSLGTAIIPVWLPVFMEKLMAGKYVIDAVFDANMEVKNKFFTPAAWACLHLFGNPYLKVETI